MLDLVLGSALQIFLIIKFCKYLSSKLDLANQSFYVFILSYFPNFIVFIQTD